MAFKRAIIWRVGPLSWLLGSMKNFLVSFTFNTENDFDLAEAKIQSLEPRTTAIQILAVSEEEALKWCSAVAAQLMRRLTNENNPSWEEAGHVCKIEPELSKSEWANASSFVQTVSVGENPAYEKMTPDAYMDWLENDSSDEVFSGTVTNKNTYRKQIAKKAMGAIYLGATCVLALFVLSQMPEIGNYNIYKGVAIFGVVCASLFLSWFIVCPKCERAFGTDTLAVCFPSLYFIRPCNHCQSCGLNLDDPRIET